MQSHRRRTHRKQHSNNSSDSRIPGVAKKRTSNGSSSGTTSAIIGSPPKSPSSTPLMIQLQKQQLNLDDSDKFLLKSNNSKNGVRRNSSFRRMSATTGVARSGPSFWELTGLNIVIPALSVWVVILMFFWWPELKDNALDYYYLQYPESQPLSPIPGTILPLIPHVWIYDPDKNEQEVSSRKKTVQNHLREHRQTHYYMLPQDFYDQQPPTDFNNLTADNTALEAPRIRGVLIFLHNCHQSGLHFFQLPESRIVAAHALQRGLAIFSPTASSAPALITGTSNKQNKKQLDSKQKQLYKDPKENSIMNAHEKNCWSASLDGDELLGPLLYEWARELNVTSLPRMAIGVANGANLLVTSSLYKTLRIQSMVLYAPHHPDGFDANDLERDVVPPTGFVTFPRSAQASQYTLQHYQTLKDHYEHELEEEELKREEVEEEEEEEAKEDNSNKAVTFPTTQLWKAETHPWTPTLCQERLPEYHTRCRSFFRHIQKYQKLKQQRQEERLQQNPDKQKRLKRQRLGGFKNLKKTFELLDSTGKVLQSSKSPQWIPVLESLGLDDWTTHMMAFSLSSTAKTSVKHRTKLQQQKAQLMQFPTMATPEGRSWLWASMLQEIEVAYGLQEMTSENGKQILDFLMYHAGLSIAEPKFGPRKEKQEGQNKI